MRDLSNPKKAPLLLGDNNNRIHFSADGQWLISRYAIWDTKDFHKPPLKMDGQSFLETSPDGNFLLTESGAENLHIWDFGGDLSTPVMSFKNPDPNLSFHEFDSNEIDTGNSFAFSPDNQLLIGYYAYPIPYAYV